jgi:YggT family protein
MLVNIFFTILYWLLVARIVLSWFGVNPYTTSNEPLGVLYQVTDVILRPFRRLPLRIGVLDLSPVVAFLALQFIQRLRVIGLYRLAVVFH